MATGRYTLNRTEKATAFLAILPIIAAAIIGSAPIVAALFGGAQ